MKPETKQDPNKNQMKHQMFTLHQKASRVVQPEGDPTVIVLKVLA